MRAWTATAAELVLGAFCPGCGAPSLPLCPACAGLVTPRPRKVVETSLPVVAAGDHADVLRRLILTWKERGRHGLTRVLSAHLAASVLALDVDPPLTLVPVPTSGRSRRARGADLTCELAAAAAHRLAAVGTQASVAPVLSVVRRAADQAGLSASERRANVASSQRALPRLLGGSVIVIDDIWTTGATTAESVRALSAVNVKPVGIAVVARTPLRSE